MSAQQSATKPTRREYDTNAHDEIIISLGCELEMLAFEYRRLDNVAGDAADELNRARASSARDHAYGRMTDICPTIAALKAESLEAAAIQMRVVAHYSSMDVEEVETQMQALIFSVVGVIESQGGFGRDQWAGDFYFGTNDPFAKLEAGA